MNHRNPDMPKDITNLYTEQDRIRLVYVVDHSQHKYDTALCVDRSMSNLCTLHGLLLYLLPQQESTTIILLCSLLKSCYQH